MTKYTIVGQGLAGTLLSHALMQYGVEVNVVDDGHPQASSRVAAGIMNPYTGRNYVKSWLYDELYPEAITTYRELEALLGVSILKQIPVVRALPDIKAENDWLAHAETAIDDKTASVIEDLSLYHDTFHGFNAAAIFHKAGRCELGTLVKAYRDYLLSRGLFNDGKADYAALIADTDRRVIFCEGSGMPQNPFFNYLPLAPMKGEVLVVRIPGYPFPNQIIKHELMIAPLGDDTYWVGSNYDNHYTDIAPTAKVRADFEAILNEKLKLPYTVMAHLAGVRPASRDRRPILGQHPTVAHFYLFNGLGTKGTSLGPYFAKRMAAYLIEGKALPDECSITRFAKKHQPPTAFTI